MSDFNETQDCIIEIMAVWVLLLILFMTVAYCCVLLSVMRWVESSAEQRRNSTSDQHGNTSQPIQINSTSTAVKLKDSNIKDSTFQLQEKKEENPSLKMPNQQKNKNLKIQSLEEKKKQQELQQASQLEIRRLRQEIQSNKEIIQKQVKQIRKDQQELEKQQQKIKKNNQKLEKKLLPENEQKMNDNPSPAANDIAAAPTVLAMPLADNQPLSQICQDSIAEVDVTEKQVCVENIQNDMLQAEQDEELGSEFQEVKRRRRRAKMDKLPETSTEITQVNAAQDLNEIRHSVEKSQNKLNVDQEALKTEHGPEEKKEENPSLKIQKQQKNKNLNSQNLEEKRNQHELQQALQLEIRRQRQVIHLNNEIIHKLAKQLRKNQQELEKQQQKIKKNNQKLEKKLLPENEQKMNDNPSPAANDIAAAPTVLAMPLADNQPLSQICQDSIAEVDVTEKQVCVENIQNDMLQAEQDEELGSEFEEVKTRRRGSKMDKLPEISTEIMQVTHDAVQDLKEIQDSVGNSQNELKEEQEALKTEHGPETSSISICDENKNQNNKEIKNQKLLQELEQQLLKQELRRKRQEIQLQEEMIRRQEKQKRREKQQELEKQQRLKKEERRQQLERKRQDKLTQLQTAAPATNDIAAASTESVKAESTITNQPPCHSLQDNNSEVDLTKKPECAENDVSVLPAEKVKTANFQKTNQHLNVEINNQQTPTQIMSVAHEFPVIEVAHVKDLKALRDSVRDIKFLECSEEMTTVNCDFKNEQLCKKHDMAIKDLRNDIDNMLEKYTNFWTDIDLSIMVSKVRVECEKDSLVAIENLKVNHGMEIKNLQMYYNEKINDIHVNNGIMVNTMQRNHNTLVCHLRNLNYNQGVRQEAALRSMRELREKTLKEHEIAIKGLTEEKERLCTEHKKVVRDLQEKNKALRMEIESTRKINLPAKSETAIKGKYDSLVELSSPDLNKQNGTALPEVEGLQAEKEQQRTIIAARQQTTNDYGDTDSDTTKNSIADTIPQKTSEDYEQIFYETEQKLSLLHGCVSENCSSQKDDLQQQLDK